LANGVTIFHCEQGKDIDEFSSEAMRQLLNYAWPGNVRELENCIEHAVVLAPGKRIEATDLPSVLHLSADAEVAATTETGTIKDNEAKLLKEVLDDCDWNKKEAARRLGISRNTLYRKLKKYQISPPTLH
jgi:two-component system response regulator HydG